MALLGKYKGRFNEAATIQSRKSALRVSETCGTRSFNEAATIQSRKWGAQGTRVITSSSFNEAATIQSRKSLESAVRGAPDPLLQ